MKVRRDPHHGQRSTTARRSIRPNDGSFEGISATLETTESPSAKLTTCAEPSLVSSLVLPMCAPAWPSAVGCFSAAPSTPAARAISPMSCCRTTGSRHRSPTPSPTPCPSQRGLDKIAVRQTVNAVANTKAGAAVPQQGSPRRTRPRLIGQLKGPVRITGAQMVLLVRNQVVADMPSITLPVPRVTALDRIRRILRWTIPFSALFAVGFFVIGFMLHPNGRRWCTASDTAWCCWRC